MGTRLEFHEELCKLLGSRNVYFQPPASVVMNYPCIVYHYDYINNNFADDLVYTQDNRYQVVAIDKNPDSEIARRLSLLPRSSFDRFYTSDNLNHYSFTIYY